MKKYIVFAFILLIPVIITAKETVELEWEYYEDGLINLSLLKETDEGYIIQYNDTETPQKKAFLLNKNGKKIREYTNEEQAQYREEMPNRNKNEVYLDEEETILYKFFQQTITNQETNEVINLQDVNPEDAKDIFGKYYFLYEYYINHPRHRLDSIREFDDCYIIGTTDLDSYDSANSLYEIKYFIVYSLQGEELVNKKNLYHGDKGIISFFQDFLYDYNLNYINRTLVFYKYDLEGNLLFQEDLTDAIVNSPYNDEYPFPSICHSLVPTNDGFFISISSSERENSNKTIITKLMKLKLYHDIQTKVNGKGTIEVVGKSEIGKELLFEVKPQKGYVLSEVKVTDEYGKVITINEYKFIMPNADILVEATFVPENPNTGQYSFLIIIMIISFISMLILIALKRNNKVV